MVTWVTVLSFEKNIEPRVCTQTCKDTHTHTHTHTHILTSIEHLMFSNIKTEGVILNETI